MSKYLVIEGTDGSGKNSVADALMEHEGYVQVAEPCPESPFYAAIRQGLKDPQKEKALLPLFHQDRLWTIENVIEPLLSQGKKVISVRSFLSTLVYQKQSHPENVVDDICSSLPLYPDTLIFLDLPVEESMRRISDRGLEREVFETESKLEKVREGYVYELRRILRNETRWRPSILWVDAKAPLEDVVSMILDQLSEARGDTV